MAQRDDQFDRAFHHGLPLVIQHGEQGIVRSGQSAEQVRVSRPQRTRRGAADAIGHGFRAVLAESRQRLLHLGVALWRLGVAHGVRAGQRRFGEATQRHHKLPAHLVVLGTCFARKHCQQQPHRHRYGALARRLLDGRLHRIQ